MSFASIFERYRFLSRHCPVPRDLRKEPAIFFPFVALEQRRVLVAEVKPGGSERRAEARLMVIVPLTILLIFGSTVIFEPVDHHLFTAHPVTGTYHDLAHLVPRLLAFRRWDRLHR